MNQINTVNLLKTLDQINKEVIDKASDDTGEAHLVALFFVLDYWEFKIFDCTLCSSDDDFKTIVEVQEAILTGITNLLEYMTSLKPYIQMFG